jgi:hypothetical protein
MKQKTSRTDLERVQKRICMTSAHENIGPAEDKV